MVTKFPAKAKDTTCRKLYHMPCFAFITACTSGYAICLKAFENLKSHSKVWHKRLRKSTVDLWKLDICVHGSIYYFTMKWLGFILWTSAKILIYRAYTFYNQSYLRLLWLVWSVSVLCLLGGKYVNNKWKHTVR